MEIDFGKMCRICLSERDCIDMTDENRVIISRKQSDDDQEDVPIPIKNAFFYFSSLRVTFFLFKSPNRKFFVKYRFYRRTLSPKHQ